MVRSRQGLGRVNSPIKSPRRHNSSLRKKALVKKLNGEVHFGAVSKANLKVVVRVRPQNSREEKNCARCVVNVLDDHMLIFDPKDDGDEGFFFRGMKQRCRDLNKRQPLQKKFVFENVFGQDSTNLDVYQATAHPLVDTLLQGYNCSVFAYGATGAGKTYTMLGRPECPGITSLTLQELYKRLDEIREYKRCEVAVSYLEVYNELVRDLLGSGKPLTLQEGQQVMVQGLSLHKPNNAEELLQMLAQGNSNRSQHATDANEESSRSHAVFQIFVRQQDLQASSNANVTISKLSMIDLAGSERGAATGFKGIRFKEGSSINKSLLALGNCINALAGGQRHIPYRDSKLTRLLKDSLGGNCRSVMIATLSPASTSFDDTYNTLRYADRAKTIKTTIKNNVRNVEQHVSDYIKLVEGLKETVTSLQEKVKRYQEQEEEWKNHQCSSIQEEVKQTKQEEEVSAEEAEAQRCFQDVSAEHKALQQKLLQLESTYRVTELKLHRWCARLARVQIVNFASSKLDKTVNKCERMINCLQNRLNEAAHHIEVTRAKLASNMAKMERAQESLNSFRLESGQPSRLSHELTEKHNISVVMREKHLLAEHLQTLVEDEFKEQHSSEQIIHILLGAVKDFYLQFHQKKQCCSEVKGIFQRVVDSVDESKIVWADQHCVAEEECGQQTQATQTIGTQLNVKYFTELPNLTPVTISPTVIPEPPSSFRKSIMMAGAGTSVIPHHVQDSATFALTPTTTTIQNTPATPVSTQVSSQQCVSPKIISTPPSPVLSNITNTVSVVENLQVNSLTICSSLKSNAAPSASSQPSLTTTIDLPSSHQISVAAVDLTPYKPLSTTAVQPTYKSISPQPNFLDNIVDMPSASKLSTVSNPVRILNTTVDRTSVAMLTSPTIHATKQRSSISPRSPKLNAAYSESKIYSITECSATALQNPTNDVQPPAAPGSSVSRKLFEGIKESHDATFCIEPATETKDTLGVKSTSNQSPPVPVQNKPNKFIFSVPEKTLPRASVNKVLKASTNRVKFTRTPYKIFPTSLTPGNIKEGSRMRRSVSTPSLVAQSSTRQSSLSTKKVKGMESSFPRTTSFLNKRTSNQENVPPQQTQTKRTLVMHRPVSPSIQKSPHIMLNKP